MTEMIRLAVPVALMFLGLMFMGIVDLFFVGKVSAEAIGAVGVGTSVFSWFMIFGIGLLTGLDYLVSFAHGEGKEEDGYRACIQGVLLCVALSIPLTALMVLLSYRLDWMGINPSVAVLAGPYLRILSFSLLPALLFTAYRLYLQALGIARPAVVILVLANVLNALGNEALVLGHWGFPRMEAEGSAWATLISRIATALAIGGYVYVMDRARSRSWGLSAFRYDAARMRELLKLGMPSALQMVFEVGVFALSTAMAARLTASDLAAHQIVLNTASVTFMVPLGIGSATAVLVGRAMGRRRRQEAARAGWLGFALGLSFMALSSMMLLLFPDQILGVFTQDPSVIAVGKSILVVAALFQLSDGAQTVGTGALRGIADTRGPMVINLLGHWGVGFPLGLTLCFWMGWGIRGLWIGLATGLTCVALAVLGRWMVRTRARQ